MQEQTRSTLMGTCAVCALLRHYLCTAAGGCHAQLTLQATGSSSAADLDCFGAVAAHGLQDGHSALPAKCGFQLCQAQGGDLRARVG